MKNSFFARKWITLRGNMTMTDDQCKKIFSQNVLDNIFPPDRADRFFEALFGDVSEGAYDIALAYSGVSKNHIDFGFQLKQRAGKCLSCSLTYGLPIVFNRHPIIDINGIIREIDSLLPSGKRCGQWHLGQTREASPTLHEIPLSIAVTDA